jgi:hypothetical protein
MFAGLSSQVQLGTFRGTDDTVRLMREYALGKEGEQSFRVRQWAETIIRDIAPKDYLSEILALRAWATSPAVRYTNDPRHVELIKSPERCLLEIEKSGFALLDCDEIACLIAALGMSQGKEASFAIVGFSGPGNFTHVFARLREPKSGVWICCDPVAGPNERQMLSRIQDSKVVSVD